MKVIDVLREKMPCEVCGNNHVEKFGLSVKKYQGSVPVVRCGECGNECYSTTARAEITKVEDKRKKEKKDR